MVEIPPAHVISPTQLILLQSILPTVDLWLSFSDSAAANHEPPRSRPVYGTDANFQPNPPPDTTKVRQRAVIKIARGLLKHGIRTSALIPWLTPEPTLVKLPWYSPISMANALGYGAVLYCLVGSVVDVGAGFIQLITNRDFIELMDKPFLAHSPRNFWSQRWNRIASNMFHRSVFSPTTTSNDALQKRVAWDKSVAAMTAFTVSGLVHELLVLSLFRQTNGENLCFFWLQGLATVAEVQNFGSKYAPKGIHRVLSTTTTFVWLGVTGRLFFLPYWKRTFFSL
ncbi:hypothetical protein NQZ79_g635 [Umbelopsis isabellina]|nr:hypothetical protein NQZ79_g635 [Umbelopsis isabellina]